MDFEDLDSEYDVLIIGMGTAGLMAAKSLSKNLKVAVIDYRRMPRHKACSGIIVKQGHSLLRELAPPDYIYRTPKFLDITYLDWTNNKEHKSKKHFLNTDRKTFDEWLYNKVSVRANVHMCENTRLVDFYSSKGKFVISALKSEEDNLKIIFSKTVIGADGANSTIRNKLFNKQIPFYVAVQEIIDSKKTPDTAYFIFDQEITDHYCWIIPKNNQIELGAALLPSKSNEKFELFKNKVKEKMGIQGKGTFESALILRPRDKHDVCLGKGRVLLAGEAAGLITPSGAEGISNALCSGLNAARVINSNPDELVRAYERECNDILDRFDKKFEKAELIRDPSKRAEFF